MSNATTSIKDVIFSFFKECSKHKEVKSARDYRSTKKWVKKTCVLYAVFLAISLVEIIIFAMLPNVFEIPEVLAKVIVPAMLVLTNLGFATLIIYVPHVYKTLIKAGKIGYEIGENIQTTHIHVQHEFANNYRVSSYTESKGCLFAYITVTVRFIIWAFFCVYIGPFLTFKKITGSLNNIKKYNENSQNAMNKNNEGSI